MDNSFRTKEWKQKISETLKAKGIRPKSPMNWTGIKRYPNGNSPLKGRIRPSEVGKKISEVKKGHLVLQETREKISKTLMGKYQKEKSPHWIEDRSKVKVYIDRRQDTKNKIWIREIYKLFNYKCYFNNCDCSGRLEAHHILDWENYPELRYEIKNGILLCQAHHPRGRAKEKRLAPYFQMIVNELMPVSK